jgi:UDP-N-acetylglucosamine 2-epimerase (non-hydrolysing)
MRVMTIIGTRPEIIRLSLIIKKLDHCAEHLLVHTGQNYTESLNNIFFKELEIRTPDYCLGAKSNLFGEQISIILKEIEKLLLCKRPDKVLILGDTNSGLCAVICERMGIPVYHMEAGNRCFDTKVPEEINRKIIDAISTHALPYTPGSRENLLNEGIPKKRIFVSGNPIYEVLNSYMDKIEDSRILDKLSIEEKGYFLVTAHRAENVDIKQRLEEIVKGIEKIENRYHLPVIISVHPRTKNRLEQFGLLFGNSDIRLLEPFGFFDFVKLEKNAKCVLTDSGTVQEECCILNVPAVTVRDSTERPETIECGSNILSGIDQEKILNCTQAMLSSPNSWNYPEGYTDINVSDKIVKFILGES